jgi:type I restriction enzyme S subunit
MLPLVLPPVGEQAQIANFLEHEIAKIDILIDKQQLLIALLKEKRQALISHAVTKGLNPDAPMKDSGVEWLGEVPEHWEVSRAKYVSRIFIPQRNKPELNFNKGVSWATMEDMKSRYILATAHRVEEIAAFNAGSKILPAGAVIASCVGSFGVTSINKIDVIINQQLQAFMPEKIKAEYLSYLVMLSKTYFELIGTAATLVYVNQQGFENMPAVVPPQGEQAKIIDYVEAVFQQFENLIDKSTQAIAFMQERRTALISAAVTGKIDVRNWQPSTKTTADKDTP